MAFITFQNPLYLWYLVSIPLLIFGHFYFLRYAKHRGVKFANFEALKRVSGEKLFTKNYGLLAIRLIILICLIFGAAGTTIWYNGQSNLNDFVLAIDVSASMTAQDVDSTRMEIAKQSAIGFLNTVQQQSIRTRVGVLTFSGSTYIEEMITDEITRVENAIEEIDVRREGGTDIAGAVITGVNMLLGTDKGKAIILISDGSQTVSSDEDNPIDDAIGYADQHQVVVHTIGIGTETGPLGYLPEYYNASSVFNEATLTKLANNTGGTHKKTNTLEETTDAYNQIAVTFDQARLDIELSYMLMLLALFLIFVEWGLSNTKFRRLP